MVPDHRRKGIVNTILPKEKLEPLVQLPFTQIAKNLDTTVHLVKASLIHHNLFRGKVYTFICQSCGIAFGHYIDGQKFCSNHCKHTGQHIWNRGTTKDNNPHAAASSKRMKKNNPSSKRKGNVLFRSRTQLLLPNLNKEISYDPQSELEKKWLLQVDSSPGIKDIKESKIQITYVDDLNRECTYHPDYEVIWETGLKWLVEIKGICTDKVYANIPFAVEWCKNNGFDYRLITTGMIKSSSWSTIYTHPKNIKTPSYEWVMMQHAVVWSKMSPSTRLQVGAVLSSMTMDQIFGFGYNGDECGGPNLSTSFDSDTFVHAEENCLLKCKTAAPARLFITHSPCYRCAQKIINAKNIKEVYYLQRYRDMSGVGLLIKSGIPTYHFRVSDHIGTPTSDEAAVNSMLPETLKDVQIVPKPAQTT